MQLDRRQIVMAAALVCGAAPVVVWAAEQPETWRKLSTEPYRGKQDDIVFVDEETGWYGNGLGRVFHTKNGGETWTKLWEKTGTYVRALGFIDNQRGFLGNIGTDYFPGVTDTTPLYRTRDGGVTWTPVVVSNGPLVKGICAIDVLNAPFINAGRLDHRIHVRAAGRVGSPAFMMESMDAGETWRTRDMGGFTAMILDVRFLDERIGFIAGATDGDVSQSRALVLRTDDGGETWRAVYRSERPWETTWKLAFPSKHVGYATTQNYNPDTTVTQRYVAKTVDGGLTWRELPITQDHAFQEFGIGFVDERVGWVGAMPHGMQTRDGGKTWSAVDFGAAVNKIRIVPKRGGGKAVFTIGVDLHRLDLPA